MGSPPPKHKFPQQFLHEPIQNAETENLLSNEVAQPTYRGSENQIKKKKVQFEVERSVKSQRGMQSRNEHTQATEIKVENDLFQFEIGTPYIPQQQQVETNHQVESNSVNQTQAEINSGSHEKALQQNEDEIKHKVEKNSIGQPQFDKDVIAQQKMPLRSEQLQLCAETSICHLTSKNT